jgi:DivIVA domain-containing protein
MLYADLGQCPGMSQEQQPPRTVRPRQNRHVSAVERVRNVQFPILLRGYDRRAVDEHLAGIAQLVAELEATQLRENVVQRALEEVGEQTSRILQSAHETADEIAARSRSQAEGRIQRAEGEAEIIRREAQQHAEQVARDTDRLKADRRRLVEELRVFAEEVLAAADAALERLPDAQQESIADEPPPGPGPEDETVQMGAVAPPEAPPPEGPPVDGYASEPTGDEPVEGVLRVEPVKGE